MLNWHQIIRAEGENCCVLMCTFLRTHTWLVCLWLAWSQQLFASRICAGVFLLAWTPKSCTKREDMIWSDLVKQFVECGALKYHHHTVNLLPWCLGPSTSHILILYGNSFASWKFLEKAGLYIDIKYSKVRLLHDPQHTSLRFLHSFHQMKIDLWHIKRKNRDNDVHE